MTEADPDFAMGKIFGLGLDCFGKFLSFSQRWNTLYLQNVSVKVRK